MVTESNVLEENQRKMREGAVQRLRPMRSDPPDEKVWLPIVSPDDHLFEPADTFEGRLPQKFADQTPRVHDDRDTGSQYWLFEDRRVDISGADCSQTWQRIDMTAGAVRYDQVRRGMWDVNERIVDMDRCGIAGSLAFPSTVFGFAGRLFKNFKDPELGLACLKAYNDWLAEAWWGAYPDRLISTQLAWLPDVADAVKEIERNAGRGVRSVNFTENPEKLGLPSIHTRYWEPFWAVCEETDTVINLHVGSSSQIAVPSIDSPLEARAALFQLSSMSATADWIYSGIPLRFPKIKIVLSEGGIGWVPMMLDRLRYVDTHYPPVENDGGLAGSWTGGDLSPADVMMRNFYFVAVDDPSGFKLITDYEDEWLGHFMIETDYPHPDSTWPVSQAVMRHQLDSVPDDLAPRFAYQNACELYGLDVSKVATMFMGGRHSSRVS